MKHWLKRSLAPLLLLSMLLSMVPVGFAEEAAVDSTGGSTSEATPETTTTLPEEKPATRDNTSVRDIELADIGVEKGESGKSNHSGIGLWEVRKYVRKSKKLDLFTSKTDEFFKQELSIYDIVKKS